MEVSSFDQKSSFQKPRPCTTTMTVLYLPHLLLVHHFLTAPTWDKYFLSTLSILIFSRILSIFVLGTKISPSWHGESEPGVQGDLLILLSEDRWVRMKGPVDHLKSVTSGGWLSKPPSRPSTLTHDFLDSTSQLLVHVAVIVLASAPDTEKILVVTFALLSHVVLSLYNAVTTRPLIMKGCQVKLSSDQTSVKKYPRRLIMARELIREMGRSDFALKLGLINADEINSSTGKLKDEIVTM